MKIEGACHCGKIRYEAEIDPETVKICHCTDCQVLSGTAFRTVVQTIEDSFQLLSGKPTVYVKTAQSGNRREQTFCPECGTPIYSAAAGTGGTIVALRVGTIQQRDRLVPTEQYWHRSSQRWLAQLPMIEKSEQQPVFGANGNFGR